jgi:hypothetical protein
LDGGLEKRLAKMNGLALSSFDTCGDLDSPHCEDAATPRAGTENGVFAFPPVILYYLPRVFYYMPRTP